MINLSGIIILRILKSYKIYIFMALNILFTSSYFIYTGMNNEEIFILSPLFKYNIESFRNTMHVGSFAESIYYIPLGILLWLFILFEIIKNFGTNNANGVLLTHVTKPVSRRNYFLSLYTAMFVAFFIISIINILISCCLFILNYGFYNMMLFKLVLASIIYAAWHILIILSCLSFIVIIVKRIQLAVIISGLLMAVASFSFILKDFLVEISNYYNTDLIRLITPFTIADGYPYLFIVRHLFHVFDEQSPRELLGFYQMFGLSVDYTKDPDNGFSVYTASRHDRFIESLVLVIVPLINMLLLYGSLLIFRKMDITGD